LIKAGHRWEEIQNYTFAQIKLFLECSTELEAEDRRNQLMLTAIASQGNDKSIKKALKGLGGHG
jgi:hypothetical protein